MRRSGNLSKEELIAVANEGNFIYPKDVHLFGDLDGTNAREYLENKGFEVVRNYDTGHNGLAVTKCGIALSTNGYIYKLKK